MPSSTSIQPLSYDLIAGFTFNFCIEKIVALATQSTYSTPEREGFLVVGFGGQKIACEEWVQSAITSWEKTCEETRDTVCKSWTRTEGSVLSTLFRKYRAVGSLQPIRKLLDSDNRKTNRSDNNFNMVVINQLDCVTQNESDQFMACQYLDMLLGNTSLVIVTLTDHPSTLHLRPSLASRLSAGFLFQFPHGTSSSKECNNKARRAEKSRVRQPQKRNTKIPKPIDAGTLDTVHRIICTVASFFDVTKKDIQNGSQRRCHVRPRGLAIYCIREMTDLSSHEIGQFFGGRDHSTILHSLNITTKTLQQDQAVQADLRAIKRQLQHSNIC
ncbi:hypothetical protein N9U65_04625 [Planctomycetaceae bacterium]|nr:hypothetical protein [Planctomycetaceae bacterium]